MPPDCEPRGTGSAVSLPHLDFAARRVMLMVAPNGARRTQQDHPALPLSAAEIAAAAAALAAAGASVLHLHVRDDDGRHTLDVDAYREAIAAVRKAVGRRLVVQVTTEAVGRYRPDEQMNLVRELRPEAVSLALRELVPDVAYDSDVARFFGWVVTEGIWPQYILYDEDDVRRFDLLRKRGVFADERPHCLLVLGRYGENRQGDPRDLERLLAAADFTQFPWSACCFGQREHEAALAACAAGGHVRLGFENNLQLADGSTAGDNAELIAQFVAAIAGSPRRPATADEVREELLSR